MTALRAFGPPLVLLAALVAAYTIGWFNYRPWSAAAPELTESYFMLGHAYEQAGDDRAAATAWRQVLERVPEHVLARQSLLRAARRRHDWPVVSEQLRALIELARAAGPSAEPFITRCQAELADAERRQAASAPPYSAGEQRAPH